MAPLHQLAGVDAHIVAEVVEAHLVVGAVGDVGGVGLLTLLGGQAVDNQAHLQPQEAVHLDVYKRQTSSYSRTDLRDWKLRLSTVVWAFSMARVSICLLYTSRCV